LAFYELVHADAGGHGQEADVVLTPLTLGAMKSDMARYSVCSSRSSCWRMVWSTRLTEERSSSSYTSMTRVDVVVHGVGGVKGCHAVGLQLAAVNDRLEQLLRK
jgi:hypothetical protein